MADFILNDWSKILDSAPWQARCLHRCVSDGVYIYMCGGVNKQTGIITKYNDVWRSADGIIWERLVEYAEWSARSAHGFIYYNNLFWVMGGANQAGSWLNDVWSSSDCINWTMVTAAAGWGVRHEFAICEFNNKMIISGGYGNYDFKNDVWSSADGLNWTRDCINIDATRGGPREHTMTYFLGSLWIAGGDMMIPPLSTLRRIYNSVDGSIWNYLGDAAWQNRKEHQIVKNTADDKLAIIGGYGVGSLNDVWESIDGIAWTQIVQLNSFVARSDFGLVNHRSITYVIGGADTIGNGLNDIWASATELVVDFIGTPTTIHVGDTVVFQNITNDIYHYALWDFGYMGVYTMTGYGINTAYKYVAPGQYTVKLIVVDNNGVNYIKTKVNYITVLPLTLDFTGVPRSGRAPLKVKFTPELVE